mgnify:CR=1 FL=1
MNSVTMMGRLVVEPKVEFTQNQKTVCTFRIAVAREYKNQNGEYESDFFNCRAFGKTAERIGNNVHKGQRILIEGSVHISPVVDKKTGEKRYFTDISVAKMYFVEPASRGIGNNTNSGGGVNTTQTQSGMDYSQYGEEVDF